jgi:flagellar hook assembly protein FlgD
VVIAKARTSTKLSVDWSIVKRANKVKAVALVKAVGLPDKVSGTIAFLRNGKVVATGTVKNGQVKIKVPVGSHRGTVKISAIFRGSGNFAASTSNTVRVRVV